MKHLVTSLALLLAGSAMAQNYTISNPWSGVLGDRANFSAFAFQANAGQFPTSVNPLGSLTPTFSIGSLTLERPNDATTPTFGAGAQQTTSATTPVYVDIYTTFAAGVFGGYVGSSSSGVTWSSTVANQPFTFNFSGITLADSTKYWFVFSEDQVDGDVAQFRSKVNTSGTDPVAGPGKGYLVGDLVQVVLPTLASQDWGVSYVVGVPEPATGALAGLGFAAMLILRRRR